MSDAIQTFTFSATGFFSPRHVVSDSEGKLGELRVRELLWRAGVDPHLRERVCALVRHHMVPFFLVGREDAEKVALSISQRARCVDVALVGSAAAAKNVDVRQGLEHFAMLLTEFGRVPFVDLSRFVEFSVAERG